MTVIQTVMRALLKGEIELFKSFTYSGKSVTHWIFYTGHPVFLFWKQVILPHLRSYSVTTNIFENFRNLAKMKIL